MRKFQIPSIPPTTNKTIRFPNDLIEAVETAICRTNCTFSAFVIEAVRVAIEYLESIPPAGAGPHKTNPTKQPLKHSIIVGDERQN